MSNKKYHGLTNEELMMQYVLINDKLEFFKKGIENKFILKITKEGHLAKINLTDSDITSLKTKEWFKLLESSHKKLSNILELLLEVDEYKELYEKIRT